MAKGRGYFMLLSFGVVCHTTIDELNNCPAEAVVCKCVLMA